MPVHSVLRASPVSLQVSFQVSRLVHQYFQEARLD